MTTSDPHQLSADATSRTVDRGRLVITGGVEDGRGLFEVHRPGHMPMAEWSVTPEQMDDFVAVVLAVRAAMRRQARS